MILYLDTSSLVKLYVEEEGSEVVRTRASEASTLATSIIAYAEARAAFARARREGTLTTQDLGGARRSLDRDWVRLLKVPADETLVLEAGELAESAKLRGCDSIHLASFFHLRRVLGTTEVVFSSYDEALNRAAR